MPAFQDLPLWRDELALPGSARRLPFQLSGYKVAGLLRAALLCAAWSFVVIYLWVASQRMNYPFELEWIEGGMADQVRRIVQGEGVYVPPGIRFVPFLYPPLYFYLSAAASLVLGDGLFPLRLVSFLASLVTFAMIFLIVRNQTGDWRSGILSAGFFAATYRLAGAWLDIARVDALFLALWLLFIYVAAGRKSLPRAALAGVLVGMAFLTKQLALFLCLPVIVFLMWQNRRFALTVLGVALSVVGITTLVFDHFSAGWYSFYTFRLLFGQAEWLPSQLGVFLGNDLLFHLPLMILLGLLFFIFHDRQESRQASLSFWLAFLFSALAGALVARMKIGGYDNVLLPAYAALSICCGLGFQRGVSMARALPGSLRHRAAALLYLACLVQLGMLSYNPYAQVPDKSDLEAGHQLVRFISSVDGEVYLPDHGYLPTLAGKSTYAHHSTIWDVVRAGQHNPAALKLRKELQDALSQHLFSMVILDSDWNYCCQHVEDYYAPSGQVFKQEGVFYPVTGWARRPSVIYTPR